MFWENELIKIYLMILTIIFSLHYCEFKKITVIEKLVPDRKIKDLTNNLERRTRTNYNRYLDLHHLNSKRKPHFKRHDRILKQELDNQIFQQNLQLLQDQTKKSLLKLQNSYLENFYLKDPNNKYQTPIRPKYSIHNSSNKLRIRRDDGTTASENTECADSDDEEEVSTITTEANSNKQLLEQIVDDLNDIRQSSITPTENGKTCQLNGTWVSDIVGMGFDITFCESLTLKNTENNTTEPTTTTTTENLKNVKSQTEGLFIGGAVNINSFEVPIDEDSNHMKLLNCSWNIKAQIPFCHTTMLIITAKYAPENRVAVFVGQCRYCDRTEMVIGQWMVQKLVHDCRKIQTAQDVFGDVLRRQPRTVC